MIRVAPTHGYATANREPPPHRTKWSVPIVANGRRRTREEAARTFAGKPFAKTAAVAGISGGYYVWFIDADKDPRR